MTSTGLIRSRRPRRVVLRSAVTLIEVMVCIAMVGALLALMLPAVQTARETSRRTTCQHRLRQLALGTQHFESDRKHFPPGILGVAEAFPYEGNYQVSMSPYCWRRFQYVSFLALILPQLEELSLYDQVDPMMFDIESSLDNAAPPGAPPYTSFLDVDSAVNLGQRDMPGFQCPSDSFARSNDVRVERMMAAIQPVVYGAEAEDRLAWTNLIEYDDHVFAHGNFAGCLGAHSGGKQKDPLKRQFTGLMSSRQKIRPRDCRDGLSQTVLMGETLGDMDQGQRTTINSWLFGAVVRGRAMVPWLCPPTDSPLLGDATYATCAGFASPHPQGVHFAFGDGHVLPVERSVDWKAWYRLCGMSDQGAHLPEEADRL